MRDTAVAMLDAVDAIEELRERAASLSKQVYKLSESYEDLKKTVADMEERDKLLLDILRNDCDLDVSWDGLRRFWAVRLTEDGCILRDRCVVLEAERDSLRDVIGHMAHDHCVQEREIRRLEDSVGYWQGEAENLKAGDDWQRCEFAAKGEDGHHVCHSAAEINKLRELVYDMLVDEERGHDDDLTFYEHVERAKELGIEVVKEHPRSVRIGGVTYLPVSDVDGSPARGCADA